jgi:N-acetyl sugar amidotransferase
VNQDKTIKYCKKCVQPNNRPGIVFDTNGVCGPCKYYATLKNVDWDERRTQLGKHVDYCINNRSALGYDCIISVSGGKESARQAMIARDELGLNPLLVSTVSPPEMLTDIGVNNLSNLNSLGFDIITVEPDPIVYKTLMRVSYKQYGNYGRATELALYASALRIALAYEIKMIFLGENNSLVYGEAISCEDGGDASDLINYNTLNGGKTDWMVDEDSSVYHEYLFPYQFPNPSNIRMLGIKIVYLGYYIKDFNNISNAKFSIVHGLEIRSVPQEYTGSVHPFDALDEDFVHVNQMLKYFKFGFGKATEEVCEMIRVGEVLRDEGVDMVRRLDGKCHESYIELFCKYLNITKDEFWKIADSYRNPDLWKQEKKKWVPNFLVGSV